MTDRLPREMLHTTSAPIDAPRTGIGTATHDSTSARAPVPAVAGVRPRPSPPRAVPCIWRAPSSALATRTASAHGPEPRTGDTLAMRSSPRSPSRRRMQTASASSGVMSPQKVSRISRCSSEAALRVAARICSLRSDLRRSMSVSDPTRVSPSPNRVAAATATAPRSLMMMPRDTMAGSRSACQKVAAAMPV